MAITRRYYRYYWRNRLPGRPRIPPLPQQVILTDRDDGTLWLLSHGDQGDGTTRVSLNDTYNTTPLDRLIYKEYDGPYLAGTPTIRLFVRAGRLGWEIPDFFPPVAGIASAGPFTRDGVTAETYELIRPTGWTSELDRLGYQDVEF